MEVDGVQMNWPLCASVVRVSTVWRLVEGPCLRMIVTGVVVSLVWYVICHDSCQHLIHCLVERDGIQLELARR